MSFPVMIVLSFAVGDADDVPLLLSAINPPSLPGFAGQARVVVGDDVADTVAFLDGDVRSCRVCGCTDDAACPPTCWWVEGDLCSACAPAPDKPLRIVKSLPT